ncbi:hypothetical protein BN14_11423 [Rhizoctonia solani AG-1 IB]|uniref:Protein kinase domain-containing protein n=2 Tax=Rhizoctonia solani TaxID=456999 RepID=A0A8H3A8N1_9AGAM|nr:unnamed protein product [Rhizoctonia solani]CCO37268.1 hypothetical protein BN14_11423 [Rhizoctonia solani AG-1 IB]
MGAAISLPTLTYSVVIRIHAQGEASAEYTKGEQANLREQGKTLKRAAREMYTWSCCKHQGVLPVLGFAQFMGYIALVTPWMEGGSLKQQISQRSMQSPLQTCIELAIAVEHLHEKGIVHGDIKPDNVLMTNQGQPQLADFGSALLTITRALNFTRTYTFPFTTRFAAPETLKEQGVPPTAESDVYSLGMTMFNIMSGSPPFADKWEPLVIVEVLSKGQPSRPDFDRSLLSSDAKVKMWDLLQSCFAYEPGDRLKVSQVKDAVST